MRAKRVDMAKLQGEIDRAEELILQNMDGMLKVRLGQVELVNHQDLIARLMRQRLNLDRTSDEMERRQGQQ